ncbi:MAG: prepilin-type N-terminal cleavage/methylation domain-containing protein [Thermodesulfobacteriota bacterium]|nr:prepilin-type N-terminal cleavage/methylation domain-containing protein [Thermodesulfobacteriota bacterium]
MIWHKVFSGCTGNNKHGFTLAELMIVLAILGILLGISVPNMKTYTLRTEKVVLKSILRVLMDGQDVYFMENNKFYPDNDIIFIPEGIAREIPELGYTFAAGHKYRYIIFAADREFEVWRRIRDQITKKRKKEKKIIKYTYYTIVVYTDKDFNNNGRNDIFVARTYIRNGQVLYNRKIYQY